MRATSRFARVVAPCHRLIAAAPGLSRRLIARAPTTWARLREPLCGMACGLVLFWLNYHVWQSLPPGPQAFMNSMHGFWIALAQGARGSWLHPSWWPFWDGGIPFEFTYAPLVPASIAALAALGHISPTAAFQYLTGLIYWLAPLTLFASMWALTRAPGFSFLAVYVYSLTAVSAHCPGSRPNGAERMGRPAPVPGLGMG